MKTRVAMLFGGRSVEHEVSVISGIQAFTQICIKNGLGNFKNNRFVSIITAVFSGTCTQGTDVPGTSDLGGCRSDRSDRPA